MTGFTKTGRPASKIPEVPGLPDRACEVLSLVAQGLPDQEIATRLGISRNTVRNHVSVIYSKLGIGRRSAVIVWARERGLGSADKSRSSRAKTSRRKSS